MSRSFAMSSTIIDSDFGPAVAVQPAPEAASILLVCEHASRRLPESLGKLGLDARLLDSHIAWDPGALRVATALAQKLKAPLVHALISRLVYDCNRPPQAASAIVERSEIHDVPGNTGLSGAERQQRIEGVYHPFHDRLAGEIAARRDHLRLLVTVHSFAPVYQGKRRDVELGILHGRDARFARAMAASAPPRPARDIRLNEPYSAADGVAHTLDLHGVKNGLLNVMLEIRNDLIATPDQQHAWAAWLAPWITDTLERIAP